MNELWPALVGALASGLVLAMNRRQKDIRELFRRVSTLETKVASLNRKKGLF